MFETWKIKKSEIGLCFIYIYVDIYFITIFLNEWINKLHKSRIVLDLILLNSLSMYIKKEFNIKII